MPFAGRRGLGSFFFVLLFLGSGYGYGSGGESGQVLDDGLEDVVDFSFAVVVEIDLDEASRVGAKPGQDIDDGRLLGKGCCPPRQQGKVDFIEKDGDFELSAACQ